MGGVTSARTASEVFEEHRGLLFGIGYRILGSVTDAEDVVQDAWLRWSGADHTTVRDPRGYLVQTVTRTAIDELRRAKSRREAYVGPWLPEPLLTAPEAGDRLERSESISMAMIVVLEALSPLERAVFVLHDVFDFGYDEVAEAVGRSTATVRQLAHRARGHVREGRPRFAADPSVRRAATDRFMAACLGGDLTGLMDLLAPDVVLWADSNGSSEMPRVPLHGAEAVRNFFAASLEIYPPGMSARPAEVNGVPAAVLTAAGVVQAVVELEIDPATGRVTIIRLVRNPEKLVRVPVA